jgi:hypothetical protein
VKGRLKSLGGSLSDPWNNALALQVLNAMWMKWSDEKTLERQRVANMMAMEGIGPLRTSSSEC